MRCIDSWQVSCRWQTLREGRSVSKAFETTKKESGLNTWEQKLVPRNAGQIRTFQPLCSSPHFSSLNRGGIEVGLRKEKARVPSPSFSAQVEPKLAKGENIDYWAMFQVLLMTGNCHRHFNDWPRTYSTSQTPKKIMGSARYYPGARRRTGCEEIKLIFWALLSKLYTSYLNLWYK